jgi:hypothetical protein
MTHRNDKIYQERRKRQYNCLCGGKYTYSHRKRHIETKKHKEYLEKQRDTFRKSIAKEASQGGKTLKEEVKEYLDKSYKKYFIIIL